MSKREQLRNKYADELCRELRYQMSINMQDGDVFRALLPYMRKWLAVGTKTKYLRPNNLKKLK